MYVDYVKNKQIGFSVGHLNSQWKKKKNVTIIANESEEDRWVTLHCLWYVVLSTYYHVYQVRLLMISLW